MLATITLSGLGVATALKVPFQNFSNSCFSPRCPWQLTKLLGRGLARLGRLGRVEGRPEGLEGRLKRPGRLGRLGRLAMVPGAQGASCKVQEGCMWIGRLHTPSVMVDRDSLAAGCSLHSRRLAADGFARVLKVCSGAVQVLKDRKSVV